MAVSTRRDDKSLRGRPFVVADVGNMLAEHYASDAHVTMAVLRDSHGTPAMRQPRLRKDDLDDAGSILLGADASPDGERTTRWTPLVECFFADVDNQEHAPHASDEAGAETARRLGALVGTAGVYVTRASVRLVQPLERPLPALEAEPALWAWLLDLTARGALVDLRCKTWNWLMRAPNVVRDGKRYRSPLVDTSRMRPIRPPAGGSAARRRRGGPEVAVEFLARLPPGYVELVAPYAAAARADTTAIGSRTGHALYLALAAALCQRRLVPPEIVPAVVGAIAGAAGHDAHDTARIARDTVRRWLRSAPVTSDLRSFPLVAALVSPQPIAPPAPTAPVEDLATTTDRLYRTLRDAPDGLTVVTATPGLGKTAAARRVAVERAAGARASRTSISVPRHNLAKQVTADLRLAGARVLRVFSPLSVPGPFDGGRECRYHAAGAALAAGGQSVRRLFCADCDYRPDCKAVDGCDGPADARVVIGPHALLSELDAATGSTGLLVIDEPPPPLEDDELTVADLELAASTLREFAPRFGAAMAPALGAVIGWTRDWGALEQTGPLARALERGVDPALESAAFAHTGATDAAQAVACALEPHQHAPPLERRAVAGARGAPSWAKRLGEASRVLRAIHRGFTRPGARATLYERGSGRTLVVTSVWPALETALRRAGRCVVMAADADIYLPAYEQAVGYRPPHHAFVAGDGAPVARTLLVARGATRVGWRDAGAVRAACAAVAAWVREDASTRRVGVVTFFLVETSVRALLRELLPAPIHVDAWHYQATRGLDDWRDHDAVVTMGDPRPNLDAAARAGLDVELLACAELEQCHGRLRTVHRTRPARALHVGALMPRGWCEPIDVRGAHVGRPRREGADLDALRSAVASLGGCRATARRLGMSVSTVQRWLAGDCCPDAAALLAMEFRPGHMRHDNRWSSSHIGAPTSRGCGHQGAG